MATSNFLNQKPFSLLLTISITFFLLLLTKANSSEVLSFSIKNFGKHEKHLILQRDALVTPTGKLQLTRVENGIPVYKSLGRALYSTPIHIWDSSTGNVANFATYFSFVINATDTTKTADGLAFFLAPVDTQPQTGGGYLGVFSHQNSNSSNNQTVAVEFDTYYNQQWDPKNTPHIGIDVNTIKSKKVSSWGFKNGNVATVLITYQANSKTLVASLVYPSGKTSYIISASVDLRATVPEWVRVGFSATTGGTPGYAETHDVLSWSFVSKLPDSDCGAEENDIDLASFMVDGSVRTY